MELVQGDVGERGAAVRLRARRPESEKTGRPKIAFPTRVPLGARGGEERQTSQRRTGAESLHSLRNHRAELKSSRHVPRPTYREAISFRPGERHDCLTREATTPRPYFRSGCPGAPTQVSPLSRGDQVGMS